MILTEDELFDELEVFMRLRSPKLKLRLASIDAHIAAVVGMSSVFTWQPPLPNGGHAMLCEDTEKCVREAVLNALQECRKRLCNHIEMCERAIEEDLTT